MPEYVCPLKSRSFGQCEHAIRTQEQFNSVASVHLCSGHGTNANEPTHVNEQIRNLSWLRGNRTQAQLRLLSVSTGQRHSGGGNRTVQGNFA